MRYLIFVFSFLSLFLNCKSTSPDAINDLRAVIQQFDSKLLTDTVFVFILSERGCIACNSAYAKEVGKYVNYRNCIILSSASGTRLDLSPFIMDTVLNFINIESDLLIKNNLYPGSWFLSIRNGHVDTTMHITTENIESAIKFISREIR